MPTFPNQTLQWTLTEASFQTLKGLFQESIYRVTNTVEIYTEVDCAIAPSAPSETDHPHAAPTAPGLDPASEGLERDRFVLAIAPNLRALLLATPQEPPQQRVSLTFDRATIDQYCQGLPGVLRPSSPQQPVDLRQQHALATLLLSEVLNLILADGDSDQGTGEAIALPAAPDGPPKPDPSPKPSKSPKATAASGAKAKPRASGGKKAAKPAQASAAAARPEGEVLAALMGQIRQGCELPEIAQALIEVALPWFQVDRVVIYQVQVQVQSIKLWRQSEGPSVPLAWDDPQWQSTSSCVTYEAIAPTAPPRSILYEGEAACFGDTLGDRQGTLEARPWQAGDRGPQLTDGPRALLSAPIVVAQARHAPTLWGFLVFHQVASAHPWSDREVAFAQALADLLAIAVSLAQVEAQFQQQKHTLERTLSERGRQLKEALVGAQSANRAKNAFLATVSHELRTPLTCVIGLSATLLRWSLGQLNQQQRSYLQTIHDSGEHLLTLIESILDFSQVEGGRSVISMVEFSVAQLVYQVLQAVRDRARESSITLTVDLPIAPEDDRFVADPHRVRQILLSLLSNALKFTPEGGQVTVRVWREDDGLTLQVDDTGIGIPRDRTAQLFEDFEQLDTSFHRTHGGLGLGLALVKQLVDLHRGWIEVDSTPGRGSTFTVWLPKYAPRSAPPPAGLEDSFPVLGLPKGTVILVDSQEDQAMAICDLLTAAGYQVVWSLDGLSAVSQAAILHPHLAVIHLTPEGDGWDTIADLRRCEECRNCRILALGSASDHPPSRYAHRATIDDRLDLPLVPEQLLRTVDALLRHPPAPPFLRASREGIGLDTLSRRSRGHDGDRHES
ncbi:MAG: ATP-binding protein [Cyanobacteria bacterium]|nr:ATP-binding protein [Cyanobacteriota bacterium]